MDDIEIYYYVITSIVYVVMIIAIIGLIWGYLLSIRRVRASIDQNMRVKNKGLYWFLNFLFWLVPFAIGAGLYFFTVWYVMNPTSKQYWFPPPSTS